MQNVLQVDEIESYGAPCVLAIGIFDGLHKGHRKVIASALKMAHEKNAKACVLTFEPHPSRVIPMGREPVEIIYPPHIRAKNFMQAGLEVVFFKSFDLAFASLKPEEFVDFLVAKFPKLRGIVTGSNFLFGKKASGNATKLGEICQKRGLKYCAVDGVCLDEERISSTRLRQCLKNGDMEEYLRLAGTPYTAEGITKSGKKLGRTIGFPTLNLPWEPQCRPPYGVYAVRLIKGGRAFKGVANYGIAPSAGALTEPLLETYLLETPDFGARTKIKVEFLKFIRPEKKFANLEELTAQISRDVLLRKSFAQ